MKVRITDPRAAKAASSRLREKIEVGDLAEIPDRFAKMWINRGFAADPGEDDLPKSVESFEDMDYNDLRSMAADLPEDQKPKSQKKVDIIAALKSGGYNRRDMRAKE